MLSRQEQQQEQQQLIKKQKEDKQVICYYGTFFCVLLVDYPNMLQIILLVTEEREIQKYWLSKMQDILLIIDLVGMRAVSPNVGGLDEGFDSW